MASNCGCKFLLADGSELVPNEILLKNLRTADSAENDGRYGHSPPGSRESRKTLRVRPDKGVMYRYAFPVRSQEIYVETTVWKRQPVFFEKREVVSPSLQRAIWGIAAAVGRIHSRQSHPISRVEAVDQTSNEFSVYR